MTRETAIKILGQYDVNFNWTNGEPIPVAAVIEAMDMAIAALKARQPVVRCRDCRYYNTSGCAFGFGWCTRNGSGHGSTDNSYCSDGEEPEFYDGRFVTGEAKTGSVIPAGQIE